MSDTMQAVAVTPGVPRSARRLQLPRPPLEPGALRTRVLEVGIDGTDSEIDAGKYGAAPRGSNLLVIGHEALGRVEEVGANVGGFQPGDLVVATVRRPDDCPNCRAGESDMCLYGNYTERGIRGAHGYMGEYYSEVPEFLIKIPPSMRPFAVLLEPLSVVEKAVAQAWKLQERLHWEPKRAVVLGAGPIGLLAVILLRLRGLEVHTYAATPSGDYRTQVIESLGAEYESVQDRPLDSLKAHLGQIDFILEATGASLVAFQAMAALGTNGALALTGVSAGQRRLEVPADALNLSLVLGNRVVFGSVNANRRYFEMGVGHFQEADRRWPGIFQRLITRRVPFNEFRSALDRKPEDIKTVLVVAPD